MKQNKYEALNAESSFKQENPKRQLVHWTDCCRHSQDQHYPSICSLYSVKELMVGQDTLTCTRTTGNITNITDFGRDFLWLWKYFVPFIQIECFEYSQD